MTETGKIWTSFKGNELDENGHIKGCTPTLITRTSEVTRKMIDNIETYTIDQFVKLNIDPEIVKKQKLEIERQQLEIEMLKKENEELKAKIQHIY